MTIQSPKMARARWGRTEWPPRLFVALVVAMVVAMVAPGIAGAEPAADATRWIPGISFQSGVAGMNVQAGVSSTNRGNFEGDGRPVVPYVGASFELASPVIAVLPGSPRLFASGGFDFILDLERSIAREGDPGKVSVFAVDNDGPGGNPPTFPPANNVTGVGSETTSRSGQLALHAGAGVALSVSIMDRELRIKPSLQYRYDELEMKSALSDAESIAGDDICPCRILQISSQTSKRFHSLGPGLELEMDAGRAGPFMTTVGMSFQGLYGLGDRSISLRSSGNFDNGDPASAVSTLRRSPWTFRGGIVVSLRWLPE